MPTKPLTICAVTSEIAPFSKTGGLGDVTRSLSLALNELGHTMYVFSPLYKTINKEKLERVIENEAVAVDDTYTATYSVWKGYENSLPVFLIEQEDLSKPESFYGSGYDGKRFLLFDICTTDAMVKLDLHPDIVQCHDWQSGLVPRYIHKKYNDHENFAKTAIIFTLHNLTYQSGNNWWEIPDSKKDNGRGPLPTFRSPAKLECINFAKRAIRHSDMINTVSEQYAEEIMTEKFGQTLHHMLNKRKDKVVGIVNGIDYTHLNPATDPGLIENYDYDALHKKTKNKIWLQEQLGLSVNPKIPLMSWTSRLAEQKGIELLIEIIEPLLRQEAQVVILGKGDKQYEEYFSKLGKKYPKKLCAYSPYIKTETSSFQYDNKQETRVLAASDIFIMPSRFEPCGLGQLKSLRYGAIPVVHKVGGLADTIQNFNTRRGTGNGFVFSTYDSRDMLVALTRAIENHKHRNTWLHLVRHAMQQSFSWEIPAQKYTKLFQKALRLKQ
ncbi:MAG: glycogen synthase [Patescibacteria group bacterium]